MSQQMAPPPPPFQPYYPVPAQTNPLATAGMVLGIICAITWGAGLAELAMVVLAITFGSLGMGRKRRHLPGQGKAKAALILGIAGGVAYITVGIISAGITLLV